MAKPYTLCRGVVAVPHDRRSNASTLQASDQRAASRQIIAIASEATACAEVVTVRMQAHSRNPTTKHT